MSKAVLQARALRGMPSRLSGANKDKNTSSSKIDRDSRIPKEWEKPEDGRDALNPYSIKKGESCVVLA